MAPRPKETPATAAHPTPELRSARHQASTEATANMANSGSISAFTPFLIVFRASR